MIHYLKIRNFEAIKDEVEINFEVADGIEEDAYEVEMPDGRKLIKLAYIYGANASGKTTVLNAFQFIKDLLLDPVEGKADELNFEPFLFQENPYQVPSSFELSFYVTGVRYVYEVVFNKQAILTEKIVFYGTAKPTELFSRETDAEKRLTKIQFGSKIKIQARSKDIIESFTLHNNTVFGAYVKTNVDVPELEKLNLWFDDFLLDTVSSLNDLTAKTAFQINGSKDVNEWINLFLNKADSQITSVNVPDFNDYRDMPLGDIIGKNELDNLSNYKTLTNIRSNKNFKNVNSLLYSGLLQNKIEFVHSFNGNNYSLPIQKESSGTKRYFGLGGKLYELIHGSHVLCIDELETSLHPDLMKHFLQVFLMNAGQSQLLITTHNISLMEEKDFIRRDALWFAEKQNDGSVSLYSAADFDSTTLRKDASLINAYKAGRLGAKPNLGSPYLNDK